jgi:sugar phosphate isomerase/epimerase
VKLAYTIVTPEVTRMPMAWIGDHATILPALAKMGYDGVELQTRDPAAFDTVAFEKQVKDAGLVICAVSTGVIGETDNMYFMSPEPELRKRAIERYKTVIDLAARYGVDSSIGRFRGQAKWAPDRKTGVGWFRAALEELLPYAERQGVKIVLEPQHVYNLDTLNTLAETVEFITSFSAKNLTFEADIHHQGLVEKSIPAALVFGMLSGYMTFVQVSDANRLPPGLGIFNWVDVFETLRAVGYDGWISVECKQFPDGERCARYSHGFLRNVMNLPALP